jgi:hypothetical protein
MMVTNFLKGGDLISTNGAFQSNFSDAFVLGLTSMCLGVV